MVYKLIGVSGKVDLSWYPVIAEYDYDHIHKNVRNNWYTEPEQGYTARWQDVVAVYEEDQKSPFRLTKLTVLSVFSKLLQHQNIQLVSQVFNDKTVTAMRTLQTKLNISEGTIKWIDLITQWFKMMSVKSKYLASCFNDSYCEVWHSNCGSFKSLEEICTVVSTCVFNGTRGRQKKLKKHTGNAFLVATECNTLAAMMLIADYKFGYVLPAIFS